MKGFRSLVWLVGMMCLYAAGAHAGVRLDDRETQVLSPRVAMQWVSPVPVAGASNRLEGRVEVLVSIDLSPIQGRQGRIFLVLDSSLPPSFLATWETRGLLSAGRVRPGERALVASGSMNRPRLQERLVLTISVAEEDLWRPQNLQFHFEFEEEESL